jgi:hypothetical protein
LRAFLSYLFDFKLGYLPLCTHHPKDRKAFRLPIGCITTHSSICPNDRNGINFLLGTSLQHSSICPNDRKDFTSYRGMYGFIMFMVVTFYVLTLLPCWVEVDRKEIKFLLGTSLCAHPAAMMG